MEVPVQQEALHVARVESSPEKKVAHVKHQ